MAAVYVGIGSNLAKPIAQVEQAFEELANIRQTALQACSPLYRSAPLGPPDQPDFINAVVLLDSTLIPDDLLHALQTIERAHGRIRSQRWGPRTLDLDMLLYDQLQSDDPKLTLPHPGLHERLFVLQPLLDIAPSLVIPSLGSVRDLMAACPPLAIEAIKL